MKLTAKRIFALVIVLAVLFGSAVSVSASQETYDSYYYDFEGNSKSAPLGYTPTETLSKLPDGKTLTNITDMYSDKEGCLYLLDSKQSKVIALSKELEFLREITVTENGVKVEFVDAQGMCLSENSDEKYLFIADSQNRRILKCDMEGTLLKTFTQPKADIFAEDEDFIPEKVIVNDSDTVLALCKGIYKGAVVFNADGDFLGFYGSNKVQVTAQLLYDYAWKKLFGKERTRTLTSYVPVEFTNFAMDEKGFIYTITSSSQAQQGISRINFKGANLLNEELKFGDIENFSNKGEEMPTAFIDIVNMKNGIIAALDLTRGRVFIYSKDGDNLMVFGNIGSTVGKFSQVGAIESYEDRLYIYDSTNADITVFSPTEYGTALLGATRLFLEGDYVKSNEAWEYVLEKNQSFSLAYLSIGRALSGQGDYKAAMEYFKKANAKEDYSDAFGEQRKIFLTEWLWLILLIVLIAAAAIIVVRITLKRKPAVKKERNPNVFSLLLHPKRDMLYIIKESKHINLISAGIMAAWFVLEIITVNASGFIFNTSRENPLNIGIVLASSLGLAFLFVLVNWLIISIFNGNGTFLEICRIVSVALVPYIAARFVRLIMTNFCTFEESGFISIVITLGALWSLLILLVGLSQVHEFGAGGTAACFLFTLLGMVLVVFLMLLVSSVAAQIGQFLQNLWSEILCLLY